MSTHVIWRGFHHVYVMGAMADDSRYVSMDGVTLGADVTAVSNLFNGPLAKRPV